MKTIKKIIKPLSSGISRKDVKEFFSISLEYPPNVKQILNKYGNEIIQYITLKRTPVNGLITGALSVFSLGKFGERFQKSFDELFHLFIEITTTTGKKISLEKVERINMIVNPPRRPDEEVKQVSNVPQGITIMQLMENANKRLGNQHFRYDSKQNNCQHFILNVLQASGIGDQSDYEFIKQDTEKLFEGLPILKGIAHTATDTGAILNRTIQGGKLQTNPFENEKLVETIRRLRGSGLKPSSQVQSIVFDKSEFTLKQAKKWLKEHNYKYSKLDKTSTDSRYRFRQENPDNYSEFRVKNISPSIMLVLGFK
jgi:hypothetical protein